MRVLLRNRNFALFLTGSVVSLLGDWALLLALPFFVYTRTHSILSTGGLVAAELVPRLLVSPVAGVLADRWNRRYALVGADLFRACLLLALLIPASGGPVLLVYVVALLEGSAAQLFAAAEGAMLPAIVPSEDLLTANSQVSVTTAAVRLVGPPLGGLMYALLGLSASAVVDSASFLLSAVALFAIRLPAAAAAEADPAGSADGDEAGPGFVRELAEGVRCIASSGVFEALCVVLAAVMVTQGMLETLLVPFVRDVLHFDPTRYGVLAAAQGVGALLGALAIGPASRYLGSGRIVGAALVLAGACLAGFTLVRQLPLSAAALFLLSVPVVVASVWVQTYYQQNVSDRLLGRVLGLTETISAVGILVGVGAASLLGARLGIVPLMLAASAVLVVTGAGAIPALWSARTSESEETPASEEIAATAD